MTDPAHGARGHATWSASSTARNVHCVGALALAASAPPEKESIHAARGTACHQIAEKCLRDGLDPASFLGKVEHTKETPITIDEELVNSARIYVDYVTERHTEAKTEGGWLLLEQHFSLNTLNPPFDAGGTGDAVLWFPQQRLLEIVDLKNGRGVVDATENPQLRTYALGALLTNPLPGIQRVKVTIVQPNALVGGEAIRSETFHVADLLEWTVDLLAAMNRSREAIAEYEVAKAQPAALEAWTGRYLQTGKCKFCRVEGTCPAVRKDAEAVAARMERWFEAPVEQRDDPAEIGMMLEKFDLVEDWIKAVRARAHALAESGISIPGYHLVESYGHRKWGAEDDKVRADLIAVAGLAPEQIYVAPKLKSPAQIEATLGAKQKHLVKNMWIKPSTGKTLVRSSDTDRPPVLSRLETYFLPLLESQ